MRRLLATAALALVLICSGGAAMADPPPLPAPTTAPAPVATPSPTPGAAPGGTPTGGAAPAPTAPADPGALNKIGGALGGAASAITGAVIQCKTPPTPRSPTAGVASWLDPSVPDNPPKPFADAKAPNVWANYGYGGLQWTTYDLGCAGPISDGAANATVDTFGGNTMLNGAANVAAASSAVHGWVTDPTSITKPLDETVEKSGKLLLTYIWQPWSGIILAGLACWLIALGLRGDLHSVLRGAGYMLVVLTIAMAAVLTPTAAAKSWDQVIVGTIGAVDTSLTSLGRQPGGVSAAHTQSTTLVDGVLYRFWLKGMFGSADSATATTYGPALYAASTLTHAEAKGDMGAVITEKQNAWTAKMDELKAADPVAYAEAQGKGGSRLGVGITALAATVAVASFRLAADLMLLVSLMLIRFLIMAAPVLGLLALLPSMSSVLRTAGEMVAACVVNVVGLATISALHTVIITASLSGAQTTASSFAVAVVATIAAFLLAWPMFNLRRVYGGATPGKRRLTEWIDSKRKTKDESGGEAPAEPSARSTPRDSGPPPEAQGRTSTRATKKGDPPPEAGRRRHRTTESWGTPPPRAAAQDGAPAAGRQENAASRRTTGHAGKGEEEFFVPAEADGRPIERPTVHERTINRATVRNPDATFTAWDPETGTDRPAPRRTVPSTPETIGQEPSRNGSRNGTTVGATATKTWTPPEASARDAS